MQPPDGPPVWTALKAACPSETAAADLLDDPAAVVPMGTSMRPVRPTCPASAKTLVPLLVSVPMAANQPARCG